jgi:hypothetical protein
VSLKPISRKFTNELGNEISITIRKAFDMGINSQNEQQGFMGAEIVMISPNSISENTITRNEAKALFDSLKQFLETE